MMKKDWITIKTPKEIRDIIIKNDRYKWVTRCGETILVHRLIWEEHYGEIPEGYEIHHKDGDKHNNRIWNLECISNKEHKKRHKR